MRNQKEKNCATIIRDGRGAVHVRWTHNAPDGGGDGVKVIDILHKKEKENTHEFIMRVKEYVTKVVRKEI